ncbi:hypothetical protein ACFL5A_02950 [Gemmatimonadota bacterium]
MEPAPEERAARFFDNASAAFERSCAAGEVRRSFRIGGRSVVLRFAGRALEQRIVPAVGHSPIERADQPSLTVGLWTTAESGVEPPGPEWSPESFGPRGDLETGTGPVHISYSMGSRTLSAYHSGTNTAFFWTRDATDLPFWESAAPLRNIFSWWAASLGGQLVHGAGPSESGRAILLVAQGGAGKSATALTCVSEGMDCHGDDYVLVFPEPTPIVHTLYRTAKIDRSYLSSTLPAFSEMIVPWWGDDSEKAILLLEDQDSSRTGQGSELCAIAIPAVSPDGVTRVQAATAGEILQALAPTTLLQLSGAGHGAFATMAELARAVPGFRLFLGRDAGTLVESIRGLVGAGTPGMGPTPSPASDSGGAIP